MGKKSSPRARLTNPATDLDLAIAAARTTRLRRARAAAAAHPNPAVRAALAANPATPTHLLARLADDPDPAVAQAAANRLTAALLG
jgi:hypothetical protein